MKTVLRINPQILKWAREEAGFDIDAIADKLEISQDRYLEWETTGKEVPFGKLRLIATSYKRQIATFFLSELPPKIVKPTDYRKSSLVGTPLSKETLLSFRRVRKYQGLLIDIHGQEYFEKKYIWLNEYEEKFTKAAEREQLSHWLRDKLDFPFEEQLRAKDSDACYRRWRDSFARKLGIFSFQLSLPSEDTQGFSYSDNMPFCIAINSTRYSMNSRIFTLFHEFAHLLQRQSGMCMPDHVTKKQHLEYEINKSAGALLIPRDKAVRIVDPDSIYTIARKYKVSSEVYLRRMYDLDLISDSEFFNLLNIIRKKVKLPKGDGFAISPIQKCLAARGQFFYESIVSAAKNGAISYSQAAEVLGLKANYFISE